MRVMMMMMMTMMMMIMMMKINGSYPKKNIKNATFDEKLQSMQGLRL